MTKTPFKKTLKWGVATGRDFETDEPIAIPVIADRNDAISLAELVYRAIDRGRIAGPKLTAAQPIADALCDEIGATLVSGRGVKFGEYFYVRNYLTGKVNGRGAELTGENTISTRLIAGPELKLERTDFKWEFAGGDTGMPSISQILADMDGAKKDEIVKTKAFYVYGENIDVRGESRVTLTWGEGEEATTINIAPTMTGPNQLKFAWPAALADVAAGTKLTLEVKIVDDETGLVRSKSHEATLVAAP